MKSSDLLIKCLENEGVKYIFGVPGEENLDLLESLRASSIKLIITRNEQSASFMAATYGRLSGRAGVALSTLGPGATNLITGIAYAQLGGFPLVCITGQKPIKRSKQGKFQQVPIVEIAKPISKMSRCIDSADKIPVLVRRAFFHSESERPGAVLLEFPEDIARDNANAVPIKRAAPLVPAPNKNAIREAIKLINKSSAPIIIIGADAKRWAIEKEIAAFIDKTCIPFATTQLGKGIVLETHQLYLGTTSLSSKEPVHNALESADLILTIGHTTFEKPPFFPDHSRQQIIHINTTSTEISSIYQPMLEVLGEVSETLTALASGLENYKANHKFFQKFFDAKSDQSPNTGSRCPLSIDAIVSALQNASPKNAIIALDNGLYKLSIARNFQALSRNHILLDNTLATMGAGLPSAIAAKLVYPDRPVIALCGDGGFMMNSQEIETAMRLKLQLLVIILNDNGFGMIRWKQASMGFANFGLNYNNPDFVKLAQSYGIEGYRLQKDDNLDEILTAHIQKHGLHLIEIPIDYAKIKKN